MQNKQLFIRHYRHVIILPLLGVFFFGLLNCRSQAALPVRAAFLYNLDTNCTLYEQNADAKISPASLTKIMSLFIAFDDINAKKTSFNNKIKISKEAAEVGGSALRIRSGEKIALARLVAASAVVSGNDATMAIASHIGGTTKNFVKRMNIKARKLGLKKTTFINPTGLPAAGQFTTARDLMLLCKAYIKTHPEAMRFHNMHAFLHKGAIKRNTNPLLGNVPGVNGLKTGWTVSSGYHLIITAKRNNTRLLAIVLGCSSKEERNAAAKKLVDAGFRHPQKPQNIAMMFGRNNKLAILKK